MAIGIWLKRHMGDHSNAHGARQKITQKLAVGTEDYDTDNGNALHVDNGAQIDSINVDGAGTALNVTNGGVMDNLTLIGAGTTLSVNNNGLISGNLNVGDELTVVNGSSTAVRIGANSGTNSLSNNSRKFGRFGGQHYTHETEEDVGLMVYDSDGTDNIVEIGGGSTLLNAATKVRVRAAANDTTTSGTQIAEFTTSGLNLNTGSYSGDASGVSSVNLSDKTTDDLAEGATNKYFFDHDNTNHTTNYLADITGESIDELSDVDNTNKSDDRILVYNSGSGNLEYEDKPTGTSPFENMVHIQHKLNSGTNGGTFTSGSWQTRPLNTVITNDVTGASLSSNQITLPAGTYYLDSHAKGFKVNNHQARWRNVSDGSTTLQASTEQCKDSADSAGTRSWCRGKFTIASQKTFELQHRCDTTNSGNGMGNPSGWGDEIFAEVILFKI